MCLLFKTWVTKLTCFLQNKTNNRLFLKLTFHSSVPVIMHLYKEFGSKSFETRCWNEAAKYWNNLSKGTTAENLDQGEAKLRRMNSWQTCSSFLLCFSQIFLKLRTVTNCPSKMRLIRIVGPLYSITWCKGFIKFYYITYLGVYYFKKNWVC